MAIFVKESLGEYGSGWEWEDYNTYAHVFDQESNDSIPKKYYSNGTVEGVCTEDLDYTDGQMLYSLGQMVHQVSCKPHSSNAGNYYSWPTATAGGNKSSGDEPNSVCPRGWQMTTNLETKVNSWGHLLNDIYHYSSKNGQLGLMPISIPHAGYYDGASSALSDRGERGNSWSGTASNETNAYRLHFYSGALYIQRNDAKLNGRSIRCVSR